MSLTEQFQQAQVEVKKLPSRPSNDELLELYSLYKQATQGDVSGKRPSMMDITGRAKYDAWAKKKGMNQEDAMQKYVDYVAELQAKYIKNWQNRRSL